MTKIVTAIYNFPKGPEESKGLLIETQDDLSKLAFNYGLTRLQFFNMKKSIEDGERLFVNSSGGYCPIDDEFITIKTN